MEQKLHLCIEKDKFPHLFFPRPIYTLYSVQLYKFILLFEIKLERAMVDINRLLKLVYASIPSTVNISYLHGVVG